MYLYLSRYEWISNNIKITTKTKVNKKLYENSTKSPKKNPNHTNELYCI